MHHPSLTPDDLTLGQAAERLGVTYRWARELVRRGELNGRPVRESKRGREWRVEAREVERLADSRRADA